MEIQPVEIDFMGCKEIDAKFSMTREEKSSSTMEKFVNCELSLATGAMQKIGEDGDGRMEDDQTAKKREKGSSSSILLDDKGGNTGNADGIYNRKEKQATIRRTHLSRNVPATSKEIIRPSERDFFSCKGMGSASDGSTMVEVTCTSANEFLSCELNLAIGVTSKLSKKKARKDIDEGEHRRIADQMPRKRRKKSHNQTVAAIASHAESTEYSSSIGCLSSVTPKSSKTHDQISSSNTQSNGNGNGNGEATTSREFLFEKKLMPSDVAQLNRLVIPKKNAVAYFPHLNRLDKGFEDVIMKFSDDENRTWEMKFCYWEKSHSFVLAKGWKKFVNQYKLKSNHVVSFYKIDGLPDDKRHFGITFRQE